MTYFGFLIRFLFIPIITILVVTYFDHRAKRLAFGFDIKKVPLIIGVHVLLALVYTTPWDNYLVATGVWTYNPVLVTGLVFGYVPIEEYTFFIVETVFAGLWWLFIALRVSPPRFLERVPVRVEGPGIRSNKKLIFFSTILLTLTWLFFTYQFFFGDEAWNYLGIILFWALPAIFTQVLFGADILWHYRKLIFWTVVPMSLYLSLIDIIALRATTWSISKTQTTGILFFGILPLEEMVFFFITNVLIGFGMTLTLSNLGLVRFNTLKARLRRSWRVHQSSNKKVS